MPDGQVTLSLHSTTREAVRPCLDNSHAQTLIAHRLPHDVLWQGRVG